MNLGGRWVRLLAGRWQAPLAVLAVVVAGYTVLRLRPAPTPISFDQILGTVRAIHTAGDPVGAIDAAANLLTLDPPLPADQQAMLHEFIAQQIFALEQQRPAPLLPNVEKLLAHERDARRLGRPVTPDGLIRQAAAQRWLGRLDEAAQSYEAALGQILPDDRRRQVRLALIDVLSQDPHAQERRRELVAELLDDPATPEGHVWRALLAETSEFLDAGKPDEARSFLEWHGARLQTSSLKGYGEFLNGWIAQFEGRTAEADAIALWLDEWLAAQPRLPADLEEQVGLIPLHHWLTGAIRLDQGQPDAALEAFIAAQRTDARRLWLVPLTIGRALAESRLGRPEAVLEQIRAACERIRPDGRAAAQQRFARTLHQIFEERRRAGDPEAAAEYLELADRLTAGAPDSGRGPLYETLGRAYAEAAEDARDEPRRRQLHGKAGEAFERSAASLQYEGRDGGLLWAAAEEFERAQRREDVLRVLGRFIQTRSEDGRLPRALLMMGAAAEGLGEFDAALQWYERVHERFPGLQESVQARLSAAALRLTLGADAQGLAERGLLDLLEDPAVTPDATAFREAQQLLAELVYEQGRYADAIGRLEELLERYPRLPQRSAYEFWLADAYRRSAYELRSSPPAEADPAKTSAESAARFQRAAELYASLSAGPPPTELSERLLHRLAMQYRADCLFERGDADSLGQALEAYRAVAAHYESEPAALAALVQIANIHLRSGDAVEAARALERARWLLRAIPDEKLADAGEGGRPAWEQFLATVSGSALFRDVLAGAR